MQAPGEPTDEFIAMLAANAAHDPHGTYHAEFADAYRRLDDMLARLRGYALTDHAEPAHDFLPPGGAEPA